MLCRFCLLLLFSSPAILANYRGAKLYKGNTRVYISVEIKLGHQGYLSHSGHSGHTFPWQVGLMHFQILLKITEIDSTIRVY